MLKTFRSLPSTFQVLAFSPSFNFGVNEKTLKARMKTVNSIKKITKAMKMIAATKMRTDVNRLEKGKNFGVSTIETLFGNEPYLQKKKQPQSIKKTLLVPITSDRGLCGGINSGIIREVKGIVAPDRSAFKILVLGEKGTAALARPMPDLLFQSVNEIQSPLNFPVVASISQILMRAAEDCDNIQVIYNHFKTVMSSAVTRMDVMPRKQFMQAFKYVMRHDTTEPEKDWAKIYFYEFYVASKLYNAMLNGLASEQSARMNAMESASKNAGEMLDKLTLSYNKARQARITMELVEIISGAAAV